MSNLYFQKGGASKSATTERNKSTSTAKLLMDYPNQSATERLSASASKQKAENLKGCDWLQEVSVTVRTFRRSFLPRDRFQRLAMLELPAFHERLLVAVCGHDDGDDLSTIGASKERRQQLALDILSWVMAVQMNDSMQRYVLTLKVQ